MSNLQNIRKATKESLKDISNTVLSDRLSEREREGLITKKIFQKYLLKLNID